MLFREPEELAFCLCNLHLGVSDRFVLVGDLVAHEPFGGLGRLSTDTEGFGRCVFFYFCDVSLFGLTKLVELKRMLLFELRCDRARAPRSCRGSLRVSRGEFLARATGTSHRRCADEVTEA